MWVLAEQAAGQAPALGTKALLQALAGTALAGVAHPGFLAMVGQQLLQPGRLRELRCPADVDAVLW